jgi:hypothetical protein
VRVGERVRVKERAAEREAEGVDGESIVRNEMQVDS